MGEYILEMIDITMEFPGVKALDNVSFKVKKGEIHALVGENGAGKSTLMKILSGVYPTGTYEGSIVLNGEKQHFNGIKDSEKAGIAIIYQELALVKQMNICENIFLGNEIAEKGIIKWDEAFLKTQNLLNEVGLDINPGTKIINLGIGKQQLVEIAKAISKKADILILDEPTAALNEVDSENLLKIIRMLKDKGVTCIYISHKLNEVIDIADSITILRDGKAICTEEMSETNDINEDKIISFMVGRKLTQRFPRKQRIPQDVVMEVKNWTVYNPELPECKIIDNVSFYTRKGEILGIAGLMGAGRTELAMSLFGAYGINRSGSIKLEGTPLKINNPRDAIKNGISYLSEDRKGNGLILMMSIKDNITLATLDRLSRLSSINEFEEIKVSNEYIEKMRIKTPSIEQKTRNLSGGNQQKVVLSKWLMTKPKVLILDEPTRGIDVGAKYEIYNLMNELVDQGVSIVMISSELPEILGMADRILVMHKGKLNGELNWKDATQEKVMFYATGGM